MILTFTQIINKYKIMNKDVECPYCEKWQEINHDDGYGYEEDVYHEQQCYDCGKIFTFTTSIIYHYESRKADCLNGSKHKWKQRYTFPREYTKMTCEDCEETREPTNEEWKIINK
jgi:hypothetical protein